MTVRMLPRNGGDFTTASSTFRPLPASHITRLALINQLTALCRSESPVIAVVGRSGSGKTTLLSEFALYHREQAISFFVGGDYWSSSSRLFLYDCCRQMRLVDSERWQSLSESTSENELRQTFDTLYAALSRQAVSLDRPFYFIVDGLDRVPQAYGQDSILTLLPTTPRAGVYLIVSCTPESEIAFSHQVWPIPQFSLLETERYFDGALDTAQTVTVYKASSGWPGYLSCIRRELVGGRPVGEVLADLPDDLQKLLERDWDGIDLADELLIMVLAVLAFTGEAHSTKDLAEILELDVIQVIRLLRKAKFIEVGTDDRIDFTSDSHRKLAAKKLNHMRSAAELRLIKYHECNPYARGAVLELPRLYSSANQYEKMKKLIGTDFVVRGLTDSNGDVTPARGAVQILADAAYGNEDWETLAFASLIDSVIARLLGDASPTESKIRALLELDDHDEAVRLALSANLPADRLLLLSRICSHVSGDGLPVRIDILEGIEYALDRIVIARTPEVRGKLLDAATDLLPVNAQLAVRVLSRVAEVDGLTKHSGHLMDVLVGQLLLLAPEASDQVELEKYIKDEALRDFIRAASPRMSKLTSEEMMHETSAITDTSVRVFSLRAWCRANPGNIDLPRVVKEAIDLLTSTTDYSPTLRDLRELAQALLSVAASDIVQELVQRLDMIKAATIPSPLEEKARLELTLARIEKHWSIDAATERLYATYFSSETADEPDVRCLVLAHVLAAVGFIFPDDVSFKKEVIRELEKEFEEFLCDSADQDTVIRRALRTITYTDSRLAEELSGGLNTSYRRDKAYEEVLRAYVASGQRSDLERVRQLLMKIQSSPISSRALVNVLRIFSEREKVAARNENALLQDALEIGHPIARAYACAYYMKGLARHKPDVQAVLERSLTAALTALEDPEERASVGFAVCAIVGSVKEGFAKTLFEHSSSAEARLGIPVSLGSVYRRLCDLAIRLVPDCSKESDPNTAVDRLVDLVDYVESPMERSVLLSTLALRLHESNMAALSGKVVQKGIKALDSIADASACRECTIKVAPALYLYERRILFERLNTFPVQQRDSALYSAFSYVLSKRPVGDRVDLSQLSVAFDYRDAVRACELIEEMTTDDYIYVSMSHLVETLCNLVTKSGARCRLSESQALEVVRRLSQVVSSKLPDMCNIQHRGYVVACLAFLGRVRDTVTRRAKVEWDKLLPSWGQLLKQARTVPNAADRALVLIIIGEACRSNVELSKSVLAEAEAAVYDIRNSADRLDRLAILARTYGDISCVEAAQYVVSQMEPLAEIAGTYNGKDQVYRRLVETAHAIDPNLGASLASKVDNPFRKIEAEELCRALELRSDPRRIRACESAVLLEASDLILQSCLSGRAVLQPDDVIGQWMHEAFGKGFELAERTIAWFVENATRRTQNRRGSSLQGLFDRITEVMAVLHAMKPVADRVAASAFSHSSLITSSNVIVIKVGEREKALDVIGRWLLEYSSPYVKIYDPFFGADELALLRNVSSDARVQIVTAWKGQGTRSSDNLRDVEAQYRKVWRSMFDQISLGVIVLVTGIAGSGESPMHARCILGKSCGLRLDTSINGYGSKDSFIEPLDYEKKYTFERDIVDPMIANPPFEYKGQQMILHTFAL